MRIAFRCPVGSLRSWRAGVGVAERCGDLRLSGARPRGWQRRVCGNSQPRRLERQHQRLAAPRVRQRVAGYGVQPSDRSAACRSHPDSTTSSRTTPPAAIPAR